MTEITTCEELFDFLRDEATLPIRRQLAIGCWWVGDFSARHLDNLAREQDLTMMVRHAEALEAMERV